MTSTPEELIQGSAHRWNECEAAPERTLLRLSILRDLLRALHAQKSALLATAKRTEAQTLKAHELRIEELRGCSPLEGDLLELLEKKQTLKKRTKIIPDGLLQALDPEKLQRFDRQWEARMAAEAADLGWKFWQLEAWVEIASLEEWNRQAQDRLWPGGIVLFIEAATSSPTALPIWHGRWICMIHPKHENPGDMPLDWGNWPGTPAQPPSPPSWKLLFAPRRK